MVAYFSKNSAKRRGFDFLQVISNLDYSIQVTDFRSHEGTKVIRLVVRELQTRCTLMTAAQTQVVSVKMKGELKNHQNFASY
jgi:hypothetical protein